MGNTEAVIVEYEFLNNAEDAELVKKYWKDYAEAVVKAIADYVGVKYTFTGTLANENYYIVQKGDSLWSIANKFGLTVNKLKDINNLKSDLLSVGMKLLVPRGSVSSNTGNKQYVVKEGDSLYQIAKNNGTTVTELINLNNLATTNLAIGQVLMLP